MTIEELAARAGRERRSITVQYDPYYERLSSTQMASLYADIQAGLGISIRLGEQDTKLVVLWFMEGHIDKLKLERWPGSS